jgi:hypothetical protein
VEETDGRGEPGRRGRPAAARGKKGGRRPEEGDGADGWAPSVGERERGGREGRALAGRLGPKAELGRGVGLLDLFCFFSSFSFQIHFKTNFKPFKFKSFTCFQTQILTQIYSTILRLFRKPFKQLFKH